VYKKEKEPKQRKKNFVHDTVPVELINKSPPDLVVDQPACSTSEPGTLGTLPQLPPALELTPRTTNTQQCGVVGQDGGNGVVTLARVEGLEGARLVKTSLSKDLTSKDMWSVPFQLSSGNQSSGGMIAGLALG